MTRQWEQRETVTDVRRFLPQPGAEIFDPESMTREVLHERLLRWLGGGHLSVTELRRLRVLVRELAGQPAEQRAWQGVVPPQNRPAAARSP